MGVCMCVHACSCESSFIHMVIRQQWELVHLSYGSWRSNSDHQAWRQVPLPSMPSRCWVLNMTVLMKMAVLRHYWEMILFFWEGWSRNSSSAGSRLHYCSSLTSDSGCLDYTMNLESVLWPCLKKKDYLDLEEWGVLGQRNSPYVRLRTISSGYRLHSISADLPFKP